MIGNIYRTLASQYCPGRFKTFFPFSNPNSSIELKLWDPETLNDFYQDTQQVNNGADIHSQEVGLHDFT